jgi:hypothetical protein
MICRRCSSWCVEVRAQSMSSPAEYECPTCDHGLPIEDQDQADLWDEDTIGDVRYHERHEDGE